MRSRLLQWAIAVALLATISAAPAQVAEPGAPEQARPQQAPVPNPESIQIGLSTDRISITSDFSGADLTIFGALGNSDIPRHSTVLQIQGAN